VDGPIARPKMRVFGGVGARGNFAPWRGFVNVAEELAQPVLSGGYLFSSNALSRLASRAS
jgi:hypothetical protein